MAKETVILSLKYTAGDIDWEVEFEPSKHFWRFCRAVYWQSEMCVWKGKSFTRYNKKSASSRQKEAGNKIFYFESKAQTTSLETALLTLSQLNNSTLHWSHFLVLLVSSVMISAAPLCSLITVCVHHQLGGRIDQAMQDRWFTLMMCLWCACALATAQLPPPPSSWQPSAVTVRM